MPHATGTQRLLSDPALARRQMLAMGSCYALGTFNDNFFKQAGLLLAVTAGMKTFQGQATVLFALPFVLFSAWSGWLADRYSKKVLIVIAKLLEVAAMLIGAWGMITLRWEWLLGMVFCMGLNSTLFSPALNGSIPELFPPDRVPRVNALFKLATTATILIGIALAGVCLDQQWLPTARPFGQWLVAVVALLAAAVGLAGTFFMLSKPGLGSTNPFPWFGPLDSFRHLASVRRDPPLLLTLFAEAFFYFLSMLLILVINNLGGAELGLSYSLTSSLTVALLIGICGGSLLAGRGTPQSWTSLLVPASLGIGITLGCVSLIPALPSSRQLPFLLGAYGMAGICGGLYLIPLTSFIQVRPEATDKGRILGVSNCLSFTAILLAGQIFLAIKELRPSLVHLGLGFLTLAVGFGYACALLKLRQGDREMENRPLRERKDGGSLLKQINLKWTASISHFQYENALVKPLLALLRVLLKLRYRIRVRGLEAIRKDQGPVLFLPNHQALIDPVILYAVLGPGFRPRPLSDTAQGRGALNRAGLRLVRAVFIPDIRRDGRGAGAAVRAAMSTVIEALRAGENVLLYPSGKLTTNGREELGANAAVSLILSELPALRTVLIRTSGLWGSRFSRAGGPTPPFAKVLLQSCLWLAANLIFFMPRREVSIELEERKLSLPAGGKMDRLARLGLNHELETFYNAGSGSGAALDVSRHFLLGFGSRVAAVHKKEQPKTRPDLSAVPAQVRGAVYAYLREETGMSEFSDDSRLAGDLGVDSLALVSFSLWVEETFQLRVERLDTLNTVGDCLLAAAGFAGGEEDSVRVPRDWPAAAGTPVLLHVPDGTTVPEIVRKRLRLAPAQTIVADSGSGLSYRELMLQALALSRAVRRLAADSGTVGIMLPLTPAAFVVWLAALLAGKVPVMCNWTTGEQNFRHGLELTGTKQVLTSARLLDKLEHQGFRAAATGAEWVALEHVAEKLGPVDKLRAFVLSRVPGLISLRRVPKTAAILFTSGSESLPKAVPLSHANILANCRDIAAVLRIRSTDRMLGMLPPFHSLGLTGNIVLPLVFGLPVVCHPNPTEAGRLVLLARNFRTTLLVSPPTFLDAMLRQAGPGDLASFRLGFAGAEKCPDRVCAAFAEATGGVLCEGYGVTECSPVVSVNRPENVHPGSIGMPLPSVEVAVVQEDGEKRTRPGQAGMLLVRGPNVFGGYHGSSAQPFVRFEGKDWYRTGDLVSQDAEGVLTFRGRLKRFVKIGGEMISLPQMETVLEQAFGSRRPQDAEGPFLAVESAPDEAGETPRIVLFATTDISREEANAALRRAGLSGLFSVSKTEKLQSIPVLGTGKTDYRKLKELA